MSPDELSARLRTALDALGQQLVTDRFVTLLRHGEVQGGPRFRGGHEDPLTEAGWTQMRAATARELGWTRVVSSPARRCAEFAERLANERRLPLALEPALGERDFGEWEGLTADEIPADDLARFWADPMGFAPPGAEPLPRFRDRVLKGWSELIADRAPDTLIVTHGGAVRILIAAMLGLADPSGIAIEVPHACSTRLRLPAPPGRPSLIFHGA